MANLEIKLLEFPVFDETVFLIVTDDLIEAQRRYGLASDGNENDRCAGLYGKSRYGNKFVIVSAAASHGTWAHEAWHFVREMCGERDIFNSETEAYHLGFIVDRLATLHSQFMRKRAKRLHRAELRRKSRKKRA